MMYWLPVVSLTSSYPVSPAVSVLPHAIVLPPLASWTCVEEDRRIDEPIIEPEMSDLLQSTELGYARTLLMMRAARVPLTRRRLLRAALPSESAKSAETATCPWAGERMSTMTPLEEACPFFLGYGQQLMMADETSLMLDT